MIINACALAVQSVGYVCFAQQLLRLWCRKVPYQSFRPTPSYRNQYAFLFIPVETQLFAWSNLSPLLPSSPLFPRFFRVLFRLSYLSLPGSTDRTKEDRRMKIALADVGDRRQIRPPTVKPFFFRQQQNGFLSVAPVLNVTVVDMQTAFVWKWQYQSKQIVDNVASAIQLQYTRPNIFIGYWLCLDFSKLTQIFVSDTM